MLKRCEVRNEPNWGVPQDSRGDDVDTKGPRSHVTTFLGVVPMNFINRLNVDLFHCFMGATVEIPCQ